MFGRAGNGARLKFRHRKGRRSSHAIFINGEAVTIPLAQLNAEGQSVIEGEQIRPSKNYATVIWAAAVALSRYDQAHSEWLEVNEGEHRRAIKGQVWENMRQLKASVEATRIN
jgi:hypothetical protein